MTKSQQRQFIAEHIDTVKQELLKNSARLPENLTDYELRCLISNAFQAAIWLYKKAGKKARRHIADRGNGGVSEDLK